MLWLSSSQNNNEKLASICLLASTKLCNWILSWVSSRNKLGLHWASYYDWINFLKESSWICAAVLGSVLRRKVALVFQRVLLSGSEQWLALSSSATVTFFRSLVGVCHWFSKLFQLSFRLDSGASLTSNAAKTFAVCVRVEDVQRVELATFCACFQPAVTSSGESSFLPHFGCCGLYSFPVTVAAHSLWRCPLLHISRIEPTSLAW